MVVNPDRPTLVLTAIAVRGRMNSGAAKAYSMIILFSAAPIFFPQIFRRAPNHESRKKHSDRSGHNHAVTAVRLKVEENQLVDVFGEIGVRVDGLKGA